MSTRSEAPRAALRVPEVADRLSIGLTLTRELVKRGEIKSFRIGRAILIPVGEVERFVESQAAGR